jgi:hypothetical protein
VRDHECVRETSQRRAKKQNPEYRQPEAEQDRERRQQCREQTGVRDHERARETPQRKEKRLYEHRPENSVSLFKQQIVEGPVFICTCCHRLLYRTSVFKFFEDDFLNTKADLLLHSRTKKISVDGNEYICSSCKQYLKKK